MISSFGTVRHLPGFREFIISFEDPPWVGYFSIEEAMTLPLQPWYHGITIKPDQVWNDSNMEKTIQTTNLLGSSFPYM